MRRLREPDTPAPQSRIGMSQVGMAFDILKRARGPLHVSVLLQRMESVFGVAVDRESLVSSLSKKIARHDRFTRTGKNTFGLRPEAK